MVNPDATDPPKVLMVENKGLHGLVALKAFESAREIYEFRLVSSVAEALEEIKVFDPDIVIASHSLPNGDGVKLLNFVNTELQRPGILLINQDNDKFVAKADCPGFLDYVVKSNETLGDLPHITDRALREMGHIVARDVVKEALRKTERLYKELFNSVSDAVFILDQDLNFVMANDATLVALGREGEGVSGMRLPDIVADGFAEDAVAYARRTVEGEGKLLVFESAFKNQSGAVSPMEISARRIEYDGRDAVLASARDISMRKQSENELKRLNRELRLTNERLERRVWERTSELLEAQMLYRTLARNLPNAVVALVSKELKCLLIEGEAFSLLGLDPTKSLGKPFSEAWPEDLRQQLAPAFAAALKGEKQELEFSHEGVDWFAFVVANQHFGASEIDSIMFLSLDVTERKRAEHQLAKRQAQLINSDRLVALGEMAAAIAHELNQPLQILKIASDAIDMELEGTPVHEDLAPIIEDMHKQIDRAATIIRNVRTFARQDERQPLETINLAEPINAALSFFREQFLLKNIALVEEFQEGLPPVKINSGRFQQIVVNLLTNTRYAVLNKPAPPDGEKTMCVIVRLRHDPGAKRVVFEVEDDGMGMSPDVLCKCLEPFYSTKPVGEGTGLGMSIIYGIVKEFNGELEIESEEGDGCLVRVKVPVAELEPT